MSRLKILILVGGLFVFAGAAQNGCQGGAPGGLRNPPVIIPTTPSSDNFSRTFTVDFDQYPETQSIAWDFGDGTTIPNKPVEMSRSVSHEFQQNGTFNVVVHLFDGADPFAGTPASMIATGSIPVTVTGPNQLPIPAFVFTDTTDSEGSALSLNKQFDASNSRDPDGRIVSYTWLFGDGESDTGKSVSHEFPRSGRFSVRLTVEDDRGATASVSRTVAVNSLPTAEFDFQSTSEDGLTFNFDAGPSSDDDGQIVSFAWDFDDDSAIATGQTVSHTFAEPGDYKVKLTVTDEFGAQSSTAEVLNVTGVDLFVRSLTPAFGNVDTTVNDIVIDGENFESGALVELRGRDRTLVGMNIRVDSPTQIRFDVNLSGAPLGRYTAHVTNVGGQSGERENAFAVVTPDHVRLVTSMGDIVFDLVEDAPITTENFLQYVEVGFYNGTIFHRVISDFVVQGGGQLPNGDTPPGLRPPIQNEFSPDRSNLRGTVAMAKLGGDPDSATSQFFVNLADNSENLDNQNGGFTVFANVVEGMDVVDEIAAVPVDGNSKPLTDVVLIRAQRE